jgi:hypothetical protein
MCSVLASGSGETSCVKMLTMTARAKPTGRECFTFPEKVDAQFVQHSWEQWNNAAGHNFNDAGIGDAGLKELVSSNDLPAIE